MLNPRQLQELTLRNKRLRDEGVCHQLPNIQASPYIRRLYDIIWGPSPPGISGMQYFVFEAVDRSLWETRSEKLALKLSIFKVLAQSILHGLVAISSCDGKGRVYVHARKI
jgi:hypothetical protein